MPPRGRPRKGLKRIDAAIDAMLPFGFTVKQVRKCVKELLKEYGGDEGWPFIEDASYNELIAALLRDVEKESQEELALDGNQIMQDQNLLKTSSSVEGIKDIGDLMEEMETGTSDGQTESKLNLSDQEPVKLKNPVVLESGKRRRNRVDIVKGPAPKKLDNKNGAIKNELNLEKSNGKEEPAVTDERALDTLQDEISPSKSVAVAEPVSDGEGWRGNLPEQTSAHVEETKNKENPPTKVPTKRKRQFPCYGWIEYDEEEEDGNDFITLPPSSMVMGPPKAHKYLL